MNTGAFDTCQLQWTGGPQGLWILHHVHLLRRRTLAPLQNVVYYYTLIMNVRGGHWQWQWTLWKHLTHRGKWLDRVNIQLLNMSDLINVSDFRIGGKTCKVTSCHCDGTTGSGRMADFSTPGIVALVWAALPFSVFLLFWNSSVDMNWIFERKITQCTSKNIIVRIFSFSEFK